MESHRRCTRNVRLFHVDDMKGNFSRPISSKVHCKPNDEMNNKIFPSTLRPAYHAFIYVEVLLDGKIVGGHGAYMNVECHLTFTSNKDLRYRLSGGYLKLRGSLEAA